MNRPVPNILWVTVGLLALVAIIHVAMGIGGRGVPLIVSGIFEVILALCVMRGHRWAYVAVLGFSLLGVGAAIGKNFSSGFTLFLLNAIIAAPMVACTNFFFYNRNPQS